MAQKLEVVRGSTVTLAIHVTDVAGNDYVLQSGEKIIFGVKKKPTDEVILFTKTSTIIEGDVYKIEIEPADTIDLECGKYYFDVGMQSGEKYFNIIEPSLFMLEANVTKWGCAG